MNFQICDFVSGLGFWAQIWCFGRVFHDFQVFEFLWFWVTLLGSVLAILWFFEFWWDLVLRGSIFSHFSGSGWFFEFLKFLKLCPHSITWQFQVLQIWDFGRFWPDFGQNLPILELRRPFFRDFQVLSRFFQILWILEIWLCFNRVWHKSKFSRGNPDLRLFQTEIFWNFWKFDYALIESVWFLSIFAFLNFLKFCPLFIGIEFSIFVIF